MCKYNIFLWNMTLMLSWDSSNYKRCKRKAVTWPEFWAAGGVCWLHCQRTESDRAAGRRSCRQKEEDQRSSTEPPLQHKHSLNLIPLKSRSSFHLPTHNLPHHMGKRSKLKGEEVWRGKRLTALDHGVWGQSRRSVLKRSLHLMRPIKCTQNKLAN